MTRPDKDFKPGPGSTPDVAPRAPAFGKGRFTTTAPSTVEPVTDEAVIEVTVDDVSVVVRPDEVPDEASFSKYDLRPMAGRAGWFAARSLAIREPTGRESVSPRGHPTPLRRRVSCSVARGTALVRRAPVR